MVSAFTPNKRLEQEDHNSYIDSWDIPENANKAILDLALGSGVNLNLTGLSGNQTLTAPQYQPLKLIVAGAPTAATTLVVPANVGGMWVLRNNTTGGFTIGIASAAGGATVTVAAGFNTLVTCDGSATGMFLAITTPGPAAGANTNVQFNNLGVLAGSPGLTWDGTSVSTTGLSNSGNTTLGDTVGDTLTVTGTAVGAPNGLTFNTSQLVLKGTPFNQVAVGTTTVGTEMLTVAGTIKSTAGGYVFPDGTIQTSATTIPSGTVMAYAGGTVPATWFPCDGRLLVRATYLNLFNAIGTSYNIGGEAATDFRIPDLRGRVIAMLDGGTNRLRNTYFPGGNSNLLGSAGGADATQYSIPEQFVRCGYWDSPAQSTTGNTTGTQSVNVNTSFQSHNVTGLQFGGSGYAADDHYHNVSVNTGGEPLSIVASTFGTYGTTDPGYVTNVNTNVQATQVMNYMIKI